MELTIRIEDYLTTDEIKAAAMDEFRACIHNIYYRDETAINRLISNLSYEFIMKAVTEAINTDAETKIRETVAKLLEDDSHIRYVMWRKKDNWEKQNSPAIDIMNDAIKNSRDLIEYKVQEAISEFRFDDVRTAIYEGLDDILYKKVFGHDE